MKLDFLRMLLSIIYNLDYKTFIYKNKNTNLTHYEYN
jgi:hypothetical protein